MHQDLRAGYQHPVLHWTVTPPHQPVRTVPGWLLADLLYRCAVKDLARREAMFWPQDVPASVLAEWTPPVAPTLETEIIEAALELRRHRSG